MQEKPPPLPPHYINLSRPPTHNGLFVVKKRPNLEASYCADAIQMLNKSSSLKYVSSKEQEPLLRSIGCSVAQASVDPRLHSCRTEKDPSSFDRPDSLQQPLLNRRVFGPRQIQKMNTPHFSHSNSRPFPHWQKVEGCYDNVQNAPIDSRNFRIKDLHCLDRRKLSNSNAVKDKISKGVLVSEFPHFTQNDDMNIGVKQKSRPLTRHHSDESLHGSMQKEIYSSRIHSSFDELSSANRSPSLSSSDESFSRTDFSRTDADSPSPDNTSAAMYEEQLQHLFSNSSLGNDLALHFKQRLLPKDIKEAKEKSSSLDSRVNLGGGIWHQSSLDEGPKRRDDLFIPKFPSSVVVKKKKKSGLENFNVSDVQNEIEENFGHRQKSPHCLDAFQLQSLEKSPGNSSNIFPHEEGVMMAKKRSLTKGDFLAEGSYKSGRKFPLTPGCDEMKRNTSPNPKAMESNSLGRLKEKNRPTNFAKKTPSPSDFSTDVFNSLQKLISLQEKQLVNAQEKLGLHFDPTKSAKVLQLKPISPTVEMPARETSVSSHSSTEKKRQQQNSDQSLNSR